MLTYHEIRVTIKISIIHVFYYHSQRRSVIMLEMIRNIFILTGILFIVFAASWYFRYRTDYRTGFLHRTGSLLLYGYVKVCSAIAYGLDYMEEKMVSILCRYHIGDERLDHIYQKEHQKSRHSRQSSPFEDIYHRSAYNLKILK